MKELNDDLFRKLTELVYKHTGVTMDGSKKALLQSRLRGRLKERNLADFEAYIRLVESDSGERLIFIDSVTTHESYFARTKRVWDYLSQDYLPHWHSQNAGRKLRIWSAASSAGQEAYTLSLFCREFQLQEPKFSYEVLGTDVSSAIVETAKAGLYNARSVENLKKDHPALFAKYIEEASGEFKVRPEIKAPVKFEVHNLFHRLTAPQSFDLVLLRNVLIYFEVKDQETVIRQVASKMTPQGVLIVGESDSLSGLKIDLSYQVPSIYSRNKAA